MAPTSPLTILATMSTPESYHTAHTAKDSPPFEPDTTGVSSPVDDDSPLPPRYRSAVPPPLDLKTHCQIHLEEELYIPAVILLDSLLTDGSSPWCEPTKCLPARVAPPPQLALLNNLTIHPSYTSRAVEPSHLHIAARVRRYLEGVLALVGPVNANMRAAFAFQTGGSTASRGGRDRESRHGTAGVAYGQRASPGDDTSSLGSLDSDYVASRLANNQSVWRRASDFWAVLGWAFRCAAMHPHRWEHWKGWLDFMVGVLEADWDERVKLGEEQGYLDGNGRSMREGSLLAAYLDDLRRERKNVPREVMRALMAFTDDDPTDRAVYREVFDRELALATKEPKRKRAPTAVDLENDEFGDYFDWEGDDPWPEDDDIDMQWAASPTPGRPRPAGRRQGRSPKEEAAPVPFPQVCEGTAETVPFRLRLFRLLSAAADALPDRFCEVADLYEMFADRVRALPLPIFRLFIETNDSALPDFIYPSFFRNVVMDLLPNNCPEPGEVDPAIDDADGISPLMLQHCFLPFAANRVTVEDNAKLSLVLESMLWFIYSRDAMHGADGLGAAVEKGIKAREDKIKRRGASRDSLTGSERAARLALERSARSMRILAQAAGL